MKAYLGFLALAFAASAAIAGDGKHCHENSMPPAVSDNATKGYQDAMQRMHREMDIRYTGDPDTDFAAGMIPHHQAAIEMARVELAYGKNPEMRSLAKTIIFFQEQEIAWMKHWLETRASSNPHSSSTEEYKKAAMKMHEDMNVAYTGNPDVDFARGMIPHHQGAVDMAAVVVRYGRTPEMVKLAQGIISGQLAEIGLMKAWLAKQPKLPSPSPKPMHHMHHE
ncbi:MAG: DUF305 domain-containing protein [Rickettsiales bacterium]